MGNKIEPELELVSGEIYFDKDNDGSNIFRFKKICKDKYYIYSQVFKDSSNFYSTGNIIIIDYRLATNKQKAKLIKAELKHGYLWNGKELIKYK